MFPFFKIIYQGFSPRCFRRSPSSLQKSGSSFQCSCQYPRCRKHALILCQRILYREYFCQALSVRASRLRMMLQILIIIIIILPEFVQNRSCVTANLHYKDCSEMHCGSCSQMASSCECPIAKLFLLSIDLHKKPVHMECKCLFNITLGVVTQLVYSHRSKMGGGEPLVLQ